MGAVPWNLPLRFGRRAEVSPRWNLWGAHCPLELQISFLKIAFLSILDGFERSIHPWIGNDIYNFTKIAAILNFHVNMPPSWILCVFGPFLTKTFRCITAQSMLYILMPHSLRKKPYIKRNCSVYRLYNFYSIQNMLFGLSLYCDSAPISVNNEPIFTILVSFYGFQMMPSPSMKQYKSPGVAITDFRLRSTSDIKVKVIIKVAMNLVI